MCLHEYVVEFLLEQFLNAQDNGQLTGTVICDLEVLCQTTSTISRRDSNSDLCRTVDHTHDKDEQLLMTGNLHGSF